MCHEPTVRPLRPARVHRAHQAGHRTLDPYSKLLEGRIVFLGTPIDDTSANDVMAQFMHLEYAGAGPGHLPVHQLPRRLVQRDDGDLRHDAVRHCDVETFASGQAALGRRRAAGGRARRASGPRCRARAMVIHQPALTEPVAGAGRATWRSRPRSWCGCARQLEELLVRHTGRSRERSPPTSSGTRSSGAQEAVEYGLVDRVVPAARPRGPHPAPGEPPMLRPNCRRCPP